MSDDQPRAAPARFPYREHRTLAQVDRDTMEEVRPLWVAAFGKPWTLPPRSY